MIVRRSADGERMWLMTQRDHAAPCGEIASLLRDEYFDAGVREPLVQLCARHDDGWREWDASPKVAADGYPVDFQDVDKATHRRIWEAGLRELEGDLGPMSAAVLGRHAQLLSGDDRDLSHDLSRRIEALCREAWPEDDPEARERKLTRYYQLLRLSDLLTLLPCAGWRGPIESPLQNRGGIPRSPVLTSGRDWDVELSFWPFRVPVVEVRVRLVKVSGMLDAVGLERLLQGERDLQILRIRPAPGAEGLGAG